VKLWLEVLAGPIAWFVSLCVSFAYARWACLLQSKPGLFLIPLVALLVSVVSGWMSWKEWRQMGRDFPGEASGTVAANRALASGGVLLNGGFAVAILAQMVVPAILGVCE
jgi:hypothetical protein